MDRGSFDNSSQAITKCPHLKVKILGQDRTILLDSGSQVTAISEDFYRELSSKKRLSILPVSNLFVTTAIGKKSTTIKHQVWLDINLEGRDLSFPFLIIPFLTSTVILGNDWMSRNNVVLDYKNSKIEIAGKILSASTVIFERSASETLRCSQENNDTMVFVINLSGIPKHKDSSKKNKLESNEKDSKNEIWAKGEVLPLREKDTQDETIVKEISNDAETVSRMNSITTTAIVHNQNENVSDTEKDLTTSEKHCLVINEIDAKPEFVNDEGFARALGAIAYKLISLNTPQKNIVINLLAKFRSLFSDKPGCARGYEHQLRLVTKRPGFRHTYPVPLHLREPTRQAIEKMVENGVVERAVSQYCNPLRIVTKEDGSVRVCLDARFVNKIIEDDHQSPPLINELLQKFHGAKWFSKLDLTQGYWQVQLHKDSRQYTSFLFDSNLYQFCRIPFGLKTAGSGFIRALGHALKNDFDAHVSCYIDDILIGTRTFDEHIRVLEGICQRLTEFNFTIKMSKCSFFQDKVPSLGFIIASDGITPEPRKLEVIQNFEEPRNKKQLQQFLGVCNYYRQFNVNHSTAIDKLRDLLTKDKEV